MEYKHNILKEQVITDCLVHDIQNDPKIHIAILLQHDRTGYDNMLIFNIDRSNLKKNTVDIISTEKLHEIIYLKYFHTLNKNIVPPCDEYPNGGICVSLEYSDEKSDRESLCLISGEFIKYSVSKKRDGRQYYDLNI